MPDIVGRLRPPRLSSAPTSPAVGEMYYDTVAKVLYWWNSTTWVPATGSGGAATAMDPWHLVGAAGEPAFTASFRNYGGASENVVSFRKRPDGTVAFRGLVYVVSTATTNIFQLPAGYRPAGGAVVRFAVSSSVANMQVQVVGDGTVQLIGSVGVGGWVDLDGIDFDTDTVVNAVPSSTAQALDNWHTVGAAGEPAFQNSWSSVGGAYGPVAFRKDPFGHVSLKGVAQSGTNNTVIFTLPAGYRPAVATIVPVIGDSAAAGNQITINPDGTVTGLRSGTFLWLYNVEFDTETVSSWVPAQAVASAPFVMQTGWGPTGPNLTNTVWNVIPLAGAASMVTNDPNKTTLDATANNVLKIVRSGIYWVSVTIGATGNFYGDIGISATGFPVGDNALALQSGVGSASNPYVRMNLGAMIRTAVPLNVGPVGQAMDPAGASGSGCFNFSAYRIADYV